MNTKEKLDRLAELMEKSYQLSEEKGKLLELATPPEVRKAINDINQEFEPKETIIQADINSITEEIKRDVIAQGASVKGNSLHAIFMSGRISWDTKSLDGYAVAHPEITELRKQGEPSVSIRKIG